MQEGQKLCFDSLHTLETSGVEDVFGRCEKLNNVRRNKHVTLWRFSTGNDLKNRKLKI